MATSLFDLSATATTNTPIDGVSVAEGCDMANLNNGIRGLAKYVYTGLVAMGADLASGAALDLDSIEAVKFDITGVATVTAVTLTEGHWREARAVGAFLLTASATLIINGSTTNNYTTSSGDVLEFRGYAAGVVRVNVARRAASVIRTQSFIASGTYTPNANMVSCIIELVGGGGGGGGCATTTPAQVSKGGGGGGGGYARKHAQRSDIGASQVVTIGAGGAQGVGAADGVTGGTTSVGTLASATGGGGGSAGVAAGVGGGIGSGGGGELTAGDLGIPGQKAPSTYYDVIAATVAGVPGGNSFFGTGGYDQGANGASGVSGIGSGAGGSGGINGFNQGTARNGGAGTGGRVFITEFCSE